MSWAEDRAQELEQMDRESAVKTYRKPEGPEPIGECLWCQEPFPEGDKRRWCDAVCRDAWEFSTCK